MQNKYILKTAIWPLFPPFRKWWPCTIDETLTFLGDTVEIVCMCYLLCLRDWIETHYLLKGYCYFLSLIYCLLINKHSIFSLYSRPGGDQVGQASSHRWEHPGGGKAARQKSDSERWEVKNNNWSSSPYRLCRSPQIRQSAKGSSGSPPPSQLMMGFVSMT